MFMEIFQQTQEAFQIKRSRSYIYKDIDIKFTVLVENSSNKIQILVRSAVWEISYEYKRYKDNSS